jgi:hypothetical protein
MKTLKFQVAGVSYRLANFQRADLVPGSVLKLKREPGNTYDPNAVQVYAGPYHIGYVPRTHNKLLVDVFCDPEQLSTLKCSVLSIWHGGCVATATWTEPEASETTCLPA